MAGRNCTSRGSSSFGSLDSVAGSFQDFSARFINHLLEQGSGVTVYCFIFVAIVVKLHKQLINNKSKETKFAKFKKKKFGLFFGQRRFFGPRFIL
jgi:hypothetical protein